MVLALVDVVVWLGAAILVAAGALKLWRPVPAALFIRRLGIPASPVTVRDLAVVEAAVGVLVLTMAGAAVLVAAGGLYAAFLASLAAYRVRTGERSVSCGCFGASATVPLAPHAAALVVALAATTVAVLTGRESLISVLGSQTLAEAALLLVLLALVVMALVGASTGVPAADPGPPVFRVEPRGGP
jgi:Methylamine utilisation protein MauE